MPATTRIPERKRTRSCSRAVGYTGRNFLPATVTLEVTEEPKAAMDMGPLPISARLRNAFVEGIRAAAESLLGFSLTLLNVAPTLVVWSALLFFPVRFIIRRTWARG